MSSEPGTLRRVFTDELASLNFSQQFFGIAAYVAGIDFIGDDLAFGIDDEGSSLSDTGIFDEDFKITSQSMVGSAIIG